MQLIDQKLTNMQFERHNFAILRKLSNNIEDVSCFNIPKIWTTNLWIVLAYSSKCLHNFIFWINYSKTILTFLLSSVFQLILCHSYFSYIALPHLCLLRRQLSLYLFVCLSACLLLRVSTVHVCLSCGCLSVCEYSSPDFPISKCLGANLQLCFLIVDSTF